MSGPTAHTDSGGGGKTAETSRHAALAGAVRATGGMTLLSRVGGLVRDVLVGRIFGDTAIGSAFAAAFAIPNMFRRLFGEGALSAAFIPAYSAALREGRADADKLASLTVGMLGLVTGGLTVVIELVLLLVLMLGHHDAERALSIKLIMVMLPFMPLICVVAIQAGMLQVHGRFGPAASGPLVLNGFIVSVGVYCVLTGRLGDERVAYALGVATVLSGATQCWWFARLLRPFVTWTRERAGIEERARTMMRKFVPVAVGLGTMQINAFVDVLIAMWPIWVGTTVMGFTYPLDKSSNVIMSLTQRLYQFPLGVFGIAVATAVFPLLARHAHEPGAFLDTLRRGLRLSLFIGVPASAGLVLVRHDAVAVLFGHGGGKWGEESLLKSAAVLAGFGVGVWAYALNHVFTRAFYARQDTATPMRIGMAMVGLNVTLNLVLMWKLREAGLAWATSISAMVQCAVLATVLTRRVGKEMGGGVRLIDEETVRGIAKVLGCTAVMSVLVWAAGWFWPGRETFTRTVVALVGVCAVGGVSYLGLAGLLRVHELRWLMHRPARENLETGEPSV